MEQERQNDPILGPWQLAKFLCDHRKHYRGGKKKSCIWGKDASDVIYLARETAQYH